MKEENLKELGIRLFGWNKIFLQLGVEIEKRRKIGYFQPFNGISNSWMLSRRFEDDFDLIQKSS